ncbi:MAG: CHRD domain-containing protein [Verrucomicrobia bacterium]|nr:MAG: CHRD domain-containing protein [Verrucomicrobiota bacterium]
MGFGTTTTANPRTKTIKHNRMKKYFATLAGIIALSAVSGFAQSTFQGFLSGLGENPPNASPGTGFGTLVLNSSSNQITVDLSWSGLTAAATASHIHGPGGVGTNAVVLFPFSGVPAATAGAIPQQSFAITPTQVDYLFNGYLYFNVHTSTFPGGEIRAQITLVPEPSTAAVLVPGMGALWFMVRRRQLRGLR